MTRYGSSLALLAGLSESECREQLRSLWGNLQHECNRAVADYLLAKPELTLFESSKHEYWLTFADPEGVQVSITSGKPADLPADLDFEVDSIPALREFFSYFGGITDFHLPPGSQFAPSVELRVMWNADEDSAWGRVAPWDGSLAFYQGGSGDVLVVRRDGAIGKWYHEYADPDEERSRQSLEMMLKTWKTLEILSAKEEEEQRALHECPVFKLGGDFPSLVLDYLKYCEMPKSDAKSKTPFYY